MKSGLLVKLRERLEAAGYPADESSPLVRLFANGQRVAEETIRESLTSDVCDDCIAFGLLGVESGTVVSRFRIAPHHGLLMMLDPPEQRAAGEPLYVMAPSGSTNTVAQAMHREPCGTAIDLGTGCGMLALLASQHAGRVVATDANPRAAELAALSAGLNGRTNVEFRIGNWFEPVAGEAFDQIVCNPPFVISPEMKCVYRDGGLEGDSVCRLIVEQMPAHLKPGGVGQALINWIVRDGKEPLDDWTRNSGCEVLLQRLLTFEPDGYARHWLGDRADSPAFDDWMAYYGRLGIDEIGSGIITLTKPARASEGSDRPA